MRAWRGNPIWRSGKFGWRTNQVWSQISVNSVVNFTTYVVFEQAEEKEDIANSDTVFQEMSLFPANLAEPTMSLREHRIIMA